MGVFRHVSEIPLLSLLLYLLDWAEGAASGSESWRWYAFSQQAYGLGVEGWTLGGNGFSPSCVGEGPSTVHSGPEPEILLV